VIPPDLVAVQDSPIHGKGLFALRRIRKGERIGQIVGRLTTDDGPHVLWLTDDLGIEVLNDLRYINHDNHPNAAYFDDGEVAALRTIQPGEEITHHYGDDDFDAAPAGPADRPAPSPSPLHAVPVNSASPASPARKP
jgi:hypothetical protein